MMFELHLRVRRSGHGVERSGGYKKPAILTDGRAKAKVNISV